MDICFGVDYYPEHWPKERWETDARLMREMGIDVVRMAEFSWSKLEPAKGDYDFGWLDEAVALLADHGIKSILGTPTAAPPAWIVAETPEIQPIDSQGRRRYFGGRHHACQSNPVYREHIRRYVTAFAEHFGHNQNIIGWQIDNELGNSHHDLCLCESCEKRFQAWLENKYVDIKTLNQEWGAVFWSQSYQAFSQIQTPKITASGQNPSTLLDWKRFCSDLIVEFHEQQADILRAASPEKFITHNMMGFSLKVNYFDLGKGLDFASHDQYPGGHFHPEHNVLKADRLAAELDLIRGIMKKNFWIMEQQAGITGWEILGRAPKPGELGMWAIQSVAHGADAVVFFRWRTCTVGTEQYWHGILPHSGIPGRYFEEIKACIEKARPLMREIRGTLPKASVGIVFSYDQAYAFEIQPHHPDLTYTGHIMAYYRALFNRNIPVDFVNDAEDFSQYDLLIAPLQYLMSSQLEKKYKDYVQNGGTLVLTMRTGVKNSSNLCMSHAPLPGNLRDFVGLEIHEYDCLRDASALALWDGETYKCEKWCDIVKLTTARALAVYDTEFYAGSPAITVNRFGNGKAYYVGTEPGFDMAAKLVDEFIRSVQLQPLGETPNGVEISHRSATDKDYFFVINHTGEIKTIEIPSGWTPYYENDCSSSLQPYSINVYTSTR